MPINRQEILDRKREPRQPRYAENLFSDVPELTLSMHPDTRFAILVLAASPKSSGRRTPEVSERLDELKATAQERQDFTTWQERVSALRAMGRITDETGQYLGYEDKGADIMQRVVAFLSKNSRTKGSSELDSSMSIQAIRDRRKGVNSNSLTISEFRTMQEAANSMEDLRANFSGPSNQMYLLDYAVLFFPPISPTQ